MHTLQKKKFQELFFSQIWDFCFVAKIFFQTLGCLNSICIEHEKEGEGRKIINFIAVS